MSRPNDQLLLKARRTEEHARGGNETQIATLLRQTATPPSPLTLMSPSKAPRLPARSFSYLGRALVLPHLPVRYSTFPRRKKVATMGHVGLVGDRAFRVPLSVRGPNVSGGTYGGRRQSRWLVPPTALLFEPRGARLVGSTEPSARISHKTVANGVDAPSSEL